MSIDITNQNLADAIRAMADLGVMHFYRDAAFVIADAVEIADSCARSDIECNLSGAFADGWYDTTSGEPSDHEVWLEQALRYLGARGLIEHHPEYGHLVRFPKVTP